MDPFSRRSLLGLGSSVGLYSLLPDWLREAAAQAPGQQVYTRYSASSTQGKAMLAKYATAVDRMTNDVPAGDPRNWEFQWYTHWIPGPLTNWSRVAARKDAMIRQVYQGRPPADPQRKLAEAMWDNCQAHSNNPNDPGFFQEMLFLPWHRYFVFYFEQVIRAVLADPTFTLPYWDYLSGRREDLAIPDEFLDRQSPLFRQNRRPWVNAGRRIDLQNPGSLTAVALQEPIYIRSTPDGDFGFCPILDFGLHGNVHTYVGDDTNMAQIPTSAGDPIFWLHHCNIDRLWESWNRLGKPNPPWPSRTFTFASGAGGSVAAPVAGADRVALLRYQYDSYYVPPGTAEPTIAAAPLSPPSTAALAALAAPLEVKAIAPGPLMLGASSVHVPLSPPALPLSAAPPAPSMALPVPPDKRYYLLLRGIKVEAEPGAATYNVFFDLPSDATEPSTDHPSYVGTLNFFGVQPGHDEHDGAMGAGHKATFNATEAIRKLQAANRLSGSPTVTLVPRGEGHDRARPTVAELSLVEA